MHRLKPMCGQIPKSLVLLAFPNRSVLVDAREIIRAFKRSGDESLLEELRQMILNSVICLCVMQKDEISGCHF